MCIYQQQEPFLQYKLIVIDYTVEIMFKVCVWYNNNMYYEAIHNTISTTAIDEDTCSLIQFLFKPSVIHFLLVSLVCMLTETKSSHPLSATLILILLASRLAVILKKMCLGHVFE